MDYKSAELVRIIDNKAIEPFNLKVNNVIAVSAIAHNDNFRATLEKNGFKVKEHIKFTDHHWFDEEDIEDITSKIENNDIVITTTKDAVRLKDKLSKDQEKFYALEVQPEFIKGEEIWLNKIKKISQSL
jgi:tetraacyldisaccharide 4'-kinase